MAWTWWRGASSLAVAALMVGCAVGTPGRSPGRDGEIDVDASVPGVDAFVPGVDAFVPDVDAHVPDVDAFVPGVDGGPPAGRGAYLDRCTGDGDCASGRCVDDRGVTRFCTRACTSDAQCAHEHLCSDAGFCVPEDTGVPCTMPELCGDGLCLGPAGGAGHCTRDCASAADCPAGYACAAFSGRNVCVDIEKPCTATGTECDTALCLPGGLGCTAPCRTAADCPARLASLGLPPYECRVAFGSASPICVPPADIVGADPIGTSCRYDGLGQVLCRSAACDDSAPLGPMCVQSCTAQGGCAAGLGCYPLVDGSSVILVCELAGTGDLGEACGSARQCHSGLCDTAGYCTRLCADGICPTGMTCQPVPGTSVAICRR